MDTFSENHICKYLVLCSFSCVIATKIILCRFLYPNLPFRCPSVLIQLFMDLLMQSDLFLSGQFAENETNEVNFREIPSHVLSKVCMYFTYKVRYTNSSTEIPEFPIAPEIALELLMAANFLDC